MAAKKTVTSRGAAAYLHIDGIDEFMRELNVGIKQLTPIMAGVLQGEAGKVIVEMAKQRTPARSGHTRGSIAVNVDNSSRMNKMIAGDFGTSIGADYKDKRGGMSAGTKAVWLESGTRMHTIEARRGGVLAFGGIRTKRVTHPGTRGKYIMRKTLKAAHPMVERKFIEGLDDLATSMGYQL